MAASGPMFSVVIPAYNRAGKVVQAVESVLSQTMPDYDVWVIDDGSTDNTAQNLVPYLDRIHYLLTPNGGAARARNVGIQQSSGRFVAFLDSDDRWYPQKLASFSKAIQSHPVTGLFYSQTQVVNEAGETLWVDKSRAVKGNAYRAFLKGDFITLSSTVVKRDCLNEVGLFDPSLKMCMDWDLWLRITRRYPIHLVPEVLVIFEHSTRNKLTSNTQTWLSMHDRVIEKAFSLDPSLDPGMRRSIMANLACIKGRIYLEARDNRSALDWFSQAISLQPALFKAYVYWLILSAPFIMKLLPQAVRRRLRLPAGRESTQ